MITDSDVEGSIAGSTHENHQQPHAHNEYTTEAYTVAQYHAPFPITKPISSYQKIHQEEVESEETKPASLGFDYNKKSSGVLTTTPYDERVKIINKLNEKSQFISPMMPMSAY